MTENEKIAETLKTLNKAAILEVSQKNYRKAIEIFEQSKLVEETLGLRLQAAETLVNIANTYYLMQDYDSALENLDVAVNIFKKEKQNSRLFNVYQLMGTIHFQKQDYEQASRIYDQCIKMNAGRENHAKSYFQAALTCMKMDETFRAQEYFRRALAEFERLGHHEGIVDCLRYRASLFKSMGRDDLAAQDLRKCLDR
jgi:tetratricopeptide (TPR) repeat protein